MTPIAWDRTFRVISTKYPTVLVFDRIADARDFELLLEVEQLTNPRAKEEAGAYWKIRPDDRVAGPGTTPIMASFVYAQPSRFCDGTFGVYYAAHDETTAIAESVFHTERRLRYTAEPSIDIDKRIYAARIKGDYDDIRPLKNRSRLYGPDPAAYAYPQAYARKLWDGNNLDGIVYRSVRNPGGECVAAFRPRLIDRCEIAKYIQMRWDGNRVAAITEITPIPSH